MKNRVLAASGTFSPELFHFFEPDLIGGIVTRSVTLEPRQGPPPPRLAETASGLLSPYDLQSGGVENFLSVEMPAWGKFRVPLIVSVAGNSEEEFSLLAKRLSPEKKIRALEVNLSWGNLFSANSFHANVFQIIKLLKRETRFPVIAKLSPFHSSAVQARKCEASGADAISLANGFPAASANFPAAPLRLSGPAVKPMALLEVRRASAEVKIPVIGTGGIFKAEDALEFFSAGAGAVGIGTATLVNPRALGEISADLRAYSAK